MSTTCYVTVTQWSLMTWVTETPATVSLSVSYMLVDSSSGLALPANAVGNLFEASLPVGTPQALRAQAAAGIQAQETGTPGMTFVWLN